MKLKRWLGVSALLVPIFLLQPSAPTAPTAAAAAATPAAEMKLERVLPDGADQAWSVALSEDGKKVVTRPYGTTAILWDAAAGKPLQFLKGHRTGVHVGADYDGKLTSVAISADGKQVVTGSFDRTAILWDAATGKRLQTFEHTWPVSTVTLSADGKHLFTGSPGKPTIQWETATGKKLQTIGSSSHANVTRLSANGKRHVTSAEQSAILWDTDTGKKLQTFKQDDVINCLTLSADGTRVLTVELHPSSLSSDVIVWKAASGKKLLTLQVIPPRQKHGGETREPGRPLAGQDEPHLPTPRPTDREKPGKPEDGRLDRLEDFKTTWVHSVAISVEGDQIITGCDDGTTNLWDAATGKKLHTFQGHTTSVTGVALSVDGKHAWTASPWEGTTRLWDTASGAELCALLTFEAGKDWLVVTPEGFFDGSPGAWNRMTYRELGTSKVLKDDATRRKFYRPGLLGVLHRGEKPKP